MTSNYDPKKLGYGGKIIWENGQFVVYEGPKGLGSYFMYDRETNLTNLYLASKSRQPERPDDIFFQKWVKSVKQRDIKRLEKIQEQIESLQKEALTLQNRWQINPK